MFPYDLLYELITRLKRTYNIKTELYTFCITLKFLLMIWLIKFLPLQLIITKNIKVGIPALTVNTAAGGPVAQQGRGLFA